MDAIFSENGQEHSTQMKYPEWHEIEKGRPHMKSADVINLPLIHVRRIM